MKQLQAATAEGSQTFYQRLVENAGDVIFLLDREGVIVYVNSRVEHYPGLSADLLVGNHLRSIVHTDDVARCMDAIRLAAAGAPVVDFDFRAVMPDGSIRHLVVNGGLTTIEGEVRILGICRDVTESVELNQKLVIRNRVLTALNEVVLALESTGFLDSTLETALRRLLGAFDLSAGGILLREDDGFIRIRTWTAPGPVQIELREGFRADTAGYFSSLWESSDSAGLTYVEPYSPELRQIMESIGIHKVAAVPLKSGLRIVGALAVGIPANVDLSTDQVVLLNLSAGILGPAVENARLREAERAKSLQLELMAREAQHRINNNLQMIAGLLSMRDVEGDPGRATLRCLRQVRSIATVSELLGPGRPSAGPGILEFLQTIATNAVQATGRSEDVDLELTGEDCALSDDAATALGIIVNELVTNAVEHGFANRARGRIRITVERTEGVRQVLIWDDGVGLPQGFTIPEGPDASSGLSLAASLAACGMGGSLTFGSCEQGALAAIRF